jgi:large subunit ribosomal protein L22
MGGKSDMATKKKVAEEVTEEVKEEAPVAEEAPKKEKKAKKAQKEEAPAKPAKPMPTEAKATALNVRVTPRKARLVIDLVRGKDVKVALGILANVNKAASDPVSKVIKSAAANAVNNFGMDENSLYVASIWANDGLRIKRYLPRAKGSASGLVKRSCHITCVVKMR